MKSGCTFMTSLLVVFWFVFFAGLGAEAGPGRGGEEKGGGIGKIIRELNLSPEQKEKLKTIRKSHRESIKPLLDQKAEAVKKLHESMKANAAPEVLRTSQKTVSELNKKISEALFENILAVREILTPEQRSKFDGIKAKMRETCKEKMKKLGEDEDDE